MACTVERNTMREGRLKRAVFGALGKCGAVAAAEAVVQGVGILAYHGVTRGAARDLNNRRRLHIEERQFEEHMRFLIGRWRPVSLKTLCEAIEMRRPLPSRSVVVTIDDGYRNTLTVAVPLLKKFGIPATVFVLAGAQRLTRMWIDRLEAAVAVATVPRLWWEGRMFSLASPEARLETMEALGVMLGGRGVDRESALSDILARLGNPESACDPDRDLMSWDEVRVVRDAGIDIGSHGDLHEPLTGRPVEDIQAVLVESRRILISELGPGRYALSYPYGRWNRSVAAAVKDAGFYCAVTTDRGLNYESADLFALKRLLIGADDDILRVRMSLSGLRSVWGSDTPQQE